MDGVRRRGASRLSPGEEGSGSLYLPGVEELLPPVFQDVLLPLQEAHTCARRRSVRHKQSLCAFTHGPTASLRDNHVTWTGILSKDQSGHLVAASLRCFLCERIC